MNGNDDEQDSEEVEIEENPLDESELIQDYKIESLQLYDSGKMAFILGVTRKLLGNHNADLQQILGLLFEP